MTDRDPDYGHDCGPDCTCFDVTGEEDVEMAPLLDGAIEPNSSATATKGSSSAATSLRVLRVQRVYHGLSVTYRARWEGVMFCWWGFWSCWEISRSGRGFLRVCIGPARLFLVWPDGPVTT